MSDLHNHNSEAVTAAHAAPPRSTGEGPYPRLILRDVTVINGTGAPAFGPVDIVIENNRIVQLYEVTNPVAFMQAAERPALGDGGREINLSGHYVMPGLIDAHGHIGFAKQVPNAQYVYDLWLGHGVTTIRDPGCLGTGLQMISREAERSLRNEIAAPRIEPYPYFGEGRDEPFVKAEDVETWIEDAVTRGAKGVKFFGYEPKLFKFALEELKARGLGSACHHAQNHVNRANVLDTARWGLQSAEHFYGIPEALYKGREIQDFGADYNYLTERDRFAGSGRIWRQAARPGSAQWNEVRDELISLDFTLDPTFNVYIGMRDAVRVQTLPWHRDFSAPSIWNSWQPSTDSHGSVFDSWGTEEETNWRYAYRAWMDFVRDFAEHGGRVTHGSDGGWIYKLYGFANIEELELFREAGFSSLEAIRSATLHSAELLGVEGDLGTVEPGKIADLIVLPTNPLQSFKDMYGPWEAGSTLTSGTQRLTIKDGIIFDAGHMLERVRHQVEELWTSGSAPDIMRPN